MNQGSSSATHDSTPNNNDNSEVRSSFLAKERMKKCIVVIESWCRLISMKITRYSHTYWRWKNSEEKMKKWSTFPTRLHEEWLGVLILHEQKLLYVKKSQSLHEELHGILREESEQSSHRLWIIFPTLSVSSWRIILSHILHGEKAIKMFSYFFIKLVKSDSNQVILHEEILK